MKFLLAIGCLTTLIQIGSSQIDSHPSCPARTNIHGASCSKKQECCSGRCQGQPRPGFCKCRNERQTCAADNECCSYNCGVGNRCAGQEPGTTFAGPSTTIVPSDKPNIVYILADDLGYGDLNVYGNHYGETPNMNTLASEGTRFLRAYANGLTCCPSRVAIMSGRFAPRFGLEPGYVGENGFPSNTITLTDVMSDAGYATGHVGKWHLSPDDPATGRHSLDYVETKGLWQSEIHRDEGVIDEAMVFFDDYANKANPFYLQIWVRSTHHPVDPADPLFIPFENINFDENLLSNSVVAKLDECAATFPEDRHAGLRAYLADLYGFDMQVGRVMARLNQLGITDNTLVILTSDHGPAPVSSAAANVGKCNLFGSTGEFTGKKGEISEGGLRVPFIVRWPGHVSANRVDSTSIITLADSLPTLATFASAAIPSSLNLDGEDMSDAILGNNGGSRTKVMAWYRPKGGESIVGNGRYSLQYRNTGFLMFDIVEDPRESSDIFGSTNQDDVAAKNALMVELNTWRSSLGLSTVGPPVGPPPPATPTPAPNDSPQQCPAGTKDHGASCNKARDCCSGRCKGNRPGQCHCRTGNQKCATNTDCCSFDCGSSGRCV